MNVTMSLARAAYRLAHVLSQRASRVGPALASPLAGQPIWSPRRYDLFAREAYQKNVVAFRCIDIVANGVASIPWTLFKQTSDGEQVEIDDHPFLNLINKPNSRQTRQEFINEVVGYYLVAGNSFIESVGPNRLNSPPKELWTKRPDRMKILVNKRGISGYEWSGAGTQEKIRWRVNQVNGKSPIHHIRTFNPNDDWYGMSPIEAAAFNVDQHNEADAWNMSLLRNSAAPSGAVETDLSLGREEVVRLREDLRNKQQGSESAGNVLLLTHGFKWKGLSFSPRDMLIIQSKAFSARFIAFALGVPPFLVGLPEGSTFANFGEARLALWDETIVPLAFRVVTEFQNWLLDSFGDTTGLTVGLKLDEIPALELRRTSKWRRVTNAVTAGVLTPNDARKELGFGTVSGGDVLLLPLNALPVEAEEPQLSSIAAQQLLQILHSYTANDPDRPNGGME